MAILTPAELTFNGDEIKDLNEVIFEKEFTNPELNAFHKIVEGIKAKKQIAYMTQLSGLLGAGSGGCDPISATNSITSSEKFWNPEPVGDRITMCYTELKQSFIDYSLGNGVKEADLTKVDFFNYVKDVLMKYKVFEAVLRVSWFGDVLAETVINGGVLTNGTNTAHFNKIDGLWKQLFAIVAEDADRKTTDLESRNAQATFALQKFTSTDTTNKVVLNALQNMMYDSDLRLQEQPNLVYVVTKSVQDQYSRELKASNQTFTTERFENGISILKSDGIEVIAFSLWDRIIKAYYSDGTKYFLPHRAILTTKDNLLVGFDSVGTISEMEAIYDAVTKKNHIDFLVNMDAKVERDNFVQLAY